MHTKTAPNSYKKREHIFLSSVGHIVIVAFKIIKKVFNLGCKLRNCNFKCTNIFAASQII